ncbi:52 kDa repressor of the inhibitor of the protein kinase-like [Myzus persicae]|uniref:52 kDa repressor of the inhibitor of the protein kinase-like n=2 Tax=Myzus persicae TaxID=13164 RepID=UPI000B935399|nr:52 kDa repressor of the inhibitor of the protein kinase-like [Myzus persicae]
MDSIICSMKIRFSEKSLCLATSADRLMQFDYEGSSFLVEHYKDILNINEKNLKSEMLVFKNIIGDNIKDFNFIKENLNKKVFPNLYLMVQVAITLPISSATSERSFSAMRRINTYLRSTMNQDRFSNLSILHIEKDIEIPIEQILKIFIDKNKRKMKL